MKGNQKIAKYTAAYYSITTVFFEQLQVKVGHRSGLAFGKIPGLKSPPLKSLFSNLYQIYLAIDK